ncbi:MAG: histidinol dehydrogenase, partial [Clostridia bacterium]|nr:histidinol dehydrogenase [Clostridia bacterium]
MIKIYKYGEVSADEIFARQSPTANVEGTVSEIIANVIKNKDKALFEYCERFDKAKLTSLEVTEAEIDEAFASVPEEFIEIIREAAENIRA